MPTTAQTYQLSLSISSVFTTFQKCMDTEKGEKNEERPLKFRVDRWALKQKKDPCNTPNISLNARDCMHAGTHQNG
jgi:hypothetical protein